jgi:hypothetical protein
MNSFFAIRRNYSRGALKLNVDYSFDKVSDPHIMNTPDKTPNDFLEHFEFTLSGNKGEDMLANNAGWVVFSRRISDIFRSMCSSEEVELIPLSNNPTVDDRVMGYNLLGVKKRIECVDYKSSDILWSETNPDEKHILSFRKCVVRNDAIPDDVHCFFLAEYPAFPVVRNALVERIASLRPSGLIFQPLEAIG